jgi:RNA polymerase sigma factor (sigma-70 family)
MRKLLPKTPLTDEQSELVGRYFRLAIKKASHRCVDRPGLFEFYFDAAIDGLIKAVRIFDPEICRYFNHVASRCIHFEFLRLETRLFKTGRNRVSFVPTFHDEPTLGERSDDATNDLATLLGPLPFRERDYVCYRFVEGLSLGECGQRIGLGKKAVGSMERRALATLRSELAECG